MDGVVRQFMLNRSEKQELKHDWQNQLPQFISSLFGAKELHTQGHCIGAMPDRIGWLWRMLEVKVLLACAFYAFPGFVQSLLDVPSANVD